MAQTIPDSMEERLGPGEINSRRSDVWSHFVVSKDGEGKDIAICKNCQKSLSAETKNGTSHLNRHLGSRECTRQQRRLPGVPTPRQPDAESSLPPATSNCAPPETSLAHHTTQWSSWLNQEECREKIARMIALHGYPSSMVEDECFRSFVGRLNPDFQMPSRAEIEGICHSRAEVAMNELKETLARCSGQISLATGIAEIDQGRFLYMACQFIDDDWALEKRIMQVFKTMFNLPIDHSTLLGLEEVCFTLTEWVQIQASTPGTTRRLEEAIRRWDLKDRIFSVAWCQELERNLLEQKDFLDNVWRPFVQAGEGSIDEIPKQVLCVTYTSDVLSSVAETFVGALHPRNEENCLITVKNLHLNHDKRRQNYSELGLHHVGRYDMRWYTFYCNLEVLHKEYSDNNKALRDQPELDTAQIGDPSALSRLPPQEMEAVFRKHTLKPSKLKENVLTDLLRKILGTIYRAFETISSAGGPTANLCLEVLMKVRAVLQSEANDASTVLAKAVAYAKLRCFLDGKDADVVLRELQDMLDNHLKEGYLYLSIPAVLDPRFKLEYVETALNEVCGLKEAPAYTSKVKERIEDIFEEHKLKLCRILNGEGTSHMTAGTGGTEAMNIDGGTNELQRYLEDDLIPREQGKGFDVLMWWKANCSKYPVVASMARDALAMPASDMLSLEHFALIKSMVSSYCVTYPQAT